MAFLSLLAVGVFAAWQGHILLRRRGLLPGGPAADARDTWAMDGPAATGPGLAPLDPNGRINDPLASAGAQFLNGDPTGIAAPRGASFRWAQEMTGGAVCVWYEYAGALEAAAEHYRDVLRRDGFSLARDGTDLFGAHRLMFDKAGAHVSVALRRLRRNEKIVSIRITLMGAAG